MLWAVEGERVVCDEKRAKGRKSGTREGAPVKLGEEDEGGRLTRPGLPKTLFRFDALSSLSREGSNGSLFSSPIRSIMSFRSSVNAGPFAALFLPFATADNVPPESVLKTGEPPVELDEDEPPERTRARARVEGLGEVGACRGSLEVDANGEDATVVMMVMGRGLEVEVEVEASLRRREVETRWGGERGDSRVPVALSRWRKGEGGG